MAESLTAKQIERLREAAKGNYLLAADARESRSSDLKILAGTQYPGLKTTDGLADYVNLMRDSVMAKVYSMAANRPRSLVLSHDPSLRGWAKKIGRTLDTYSKRLRLERVFQRAAVDACFSLGVAKTAILDSFQVKSHPYSRAGKPSVVDVSFDHLCWDMEATDFEYCSFIADRYRVCVKDLQKQQLPASVKKAIDERESEPLSSAQAEWAEQIATPLTTESERFEDWLYCADFFLPYYQQIYTFLVDSEFQILGDDPVKKPVAWHGKSTGPHSFLVFGRVPGKIIPSTLAQNLRKQHNLINTLYRKLEDQAENQSTIFLGKTGEQDEDVNRLRDARDRQIIPWNSGAPLEKHVFPGPDPQIMGLKQDLENRYSKSSGNLDHKLGLGPSADTARQEGMIGAAVNDIEAHDNAQFIGFVREVMVELAGLLWRDASTHIPMMLTVPGGNVAVLDDWFPSTVEGSRQGEFEDYEIDIEPYSLAYKPPSQRAEELRQIWNENLQLWEVMAQSGVQPDFATYFDIQSRYRNEPELREMYKFNQPPPPVGPSEPTSRKPTGPREYLHRSAGPQGGQSQTGDKIMQLMQAGARNNQNEAAA